MIDLTGIAMGLLSLLAAWITTTVIPWIKARTTAEQRRVAQALVKTAVYAAEQLCKGSGRGVEKLRYVQERLDAVGVKLDARLLMDMIEEAVLELAIQQDWTMAHGDLSGGDGALDPAADSGAAMTAGEEVGPLG